MVVKWMRDAETVEQVGHSKKVRNYLVMPVRVLHPAADGPGEQSSKLEGWVTRRLVDKSRGGVKTSWFEEVRGAGEEHDRSSKRRQRC